MKKKWIILLLIVALLITGCSTESTSNKKQEKTNKKVEEKKDKSNLVSYNGSLKLDGVDLVNQYGEKVMLKGISSHGLQWFGDLITEENLKTLKDVWHSNVFRLAMYTDENGYISNKDILNTLESKVDLIIKQDMYVIIDWHILKDNNPNTYKKEAIEFFDHISKKYKDQPNVIYEICNEPNGSTSWNHDIKPYADEVISTIRKNSKNSIIIVGTPTWSQDILDPKDNRIQDKNTMYALHFYAGTHTDWLRNRITEARENNLPIIISEWGTSAADGNGGVFLDEAQKWVDYIYENNLSFINWSLANKEESSALLKVGTNKISDENLTESGKFVKKAIQGE